MKASNTGWSQEARVICYNILEYLNENPQAQDTLEGIAQWWLLQQQIKRSTSLIQNLLNELVEEGFLIFRQGMDHQIHYRINREKEKEILELMKAIKELIA